VQVPTRELAHVLALTVSVILMDQSNDALVVGSGWIPVIRAEHAMVGIRGVASIANRAFAAG
jgi:hypothetical protein